MIECCPLHDVKCTHVSAFLLHISSRTLCACIVLIWILHWKGGLRETFTECEYIECWKIIFIDSIKNGPWYNDNLKDCHLNTPKLNTSDCDIPVYGGNNIFNNIIITFGDLHSTKSLRTFNVQLQHPIAFAKSSVLSEFNFWQISALHNHLKVQNNR